MLNRFDEKFVELFFLAKLESGLDVRLDPDMTADALLDAFGDRPWVPVAKREGYTKASDAIIKEMWHAQEVAVVQHVDPSKRRSR